MHSNKCQGKDAKIQKQLTRIKKPKQTETAKEEIMMTAFMCGKCVDAYCLLRDVPSNWFRCWSDGALHAGGAFAPVKKERSGPVFFVHTPSGFKICSCCYRLKEVLCMV